MEKQTIVADLFYLPSIEFFTALCGHEKLLIEREGNFQKQTYLNRAYIRLANKVEVLSVPVIGSNQKRKYKEVKIDYGQKWMNIHIRGLQSGYGKAPFFEHYFPYFEKIYQKKIDNLYDFNFELLTLCLKLLRIPIQVMETTQYLVYQEEKDIRGIIKAKEPFLSRDIYQPTSYMQLFGADFVPNLSVVDLLFCEGPHAKRIIQNSRKRIEQS